MDHKVGPRSRENKSELILLFLPALRSAWEPQCLNAKYREAWKEKTSVSGSIRRMREKSSLGEKIKIYT